MLQTVTNSKSMAFGLKELAQRLGVSVAFLRLEVNRDNLRATRLGRRIVVTDAEAERYLAAHSSARGKGRDI